MTHELCLEPNDGPSWQAGRRFCSLASGHSGPHRAYWNHVVTRDGKDISWLGPWRDKREYKTEDYERLLEEWYCPIMTDEELTVLALAKEWAESIAFFSEERGCYVTYSVNHTLEIEDRLRKAAFELKKH